MSTILRKIIIVTITALAVFFYSTVDNAMSTKEFVVVDLKIDTTRAIAGGEINAVAAPLSTAKIYPKGSVIEILDSEPPAIIEVDELPELVPSTTKEPQEPVDEFTVLNRFVQGRSKRDRNEIHCLALNTFHEAARETYVGKLAVANVTQTRVNDDRWANTYCGVVKEGYRPGKKWGCQFSWHCDGRPDKVYLHSKTKDGKVLREEIYNAWVESVKIAVEVYDKKATDVTAGATHYYNPSVCYKWSIRVDKHGNRLVAINYEDFVE